jgi:hypothetical protein
VRLVPSILRCLGSDLLVRIMQLPCASLCLIMTLKLRILPHIEGFRLEPWILVELGCASIPDDLVRLRSHVLGHSIP